MAIAVATSTDQFRAAAPVTPEDLVAEAIRCIITGREFPEHLRAPSAASPGLASVYKRISAILAGPSGL